jgi:hypothetical protein
MKTIINKYELIFVFTWIVSYFIYPSWALPVDETSRNIIFSVLITYFALSLVFLNRWLSVLNIDRPFFIKTDNWLNIIKNHSELAAICLIAAILQAYPVINRPILIIGDEALHLHGGLWIYNFIDSSSHKYFQLAFWVLAGLLVILIIWKSIWNVIIENLSKYLSNNRSTGYLFVIIFSVAIVYYLFFQNWQYHPHLIRYPPLSRLIYLVLYSAFGINHLWPRILQVAFYLLSAIYLYRTILLYDNKRTALFGATLYLFFPITFVYSGLAYLSSGTVFLVILISFYFLRFIENKSSRDIILVTYFIGAGFLYKRNTFLMVFICVAYLIYCRIKSKDLKLSVSMKGMLLSMFPIIPWMIIGKYFTWRNYQVTLSNFIPPHGKIYSYFMNIPSDISWLLFVLLLISIAYILKLRKDNLTKFFLLLFISYYFLFAIDLGGISPRLAMVFNPTISIFIALFLSYVVSKAKWKYLFRTVFVILLAYLIAICAVPALNARYLKQVEMIKLQNYPSQDAMKWVKDNVRNGEKIVTIRIMTALYYRDKYEIEKNKIIDFWYEIEEVSTPEKLKEFCMENKVTYIMFPYGAVYNEQFPILKYIKENNKNEFIKIAEYNMGKNFIYIYKYRDS